MAVFRGKASVRSTNAPNNPLMNHPRTVGAVPQSQPATQIPQPPAQQSPPQVDPQQYAVQQIQQMQASAQPLSQPPSPVPPVAGAPVSTPDPVLDSQAPQQPLPQQPQPMQQATQPQPVQPPVNPVQPPSSAGPEPPFATQPPVVQKPKKSKKKLLVGMLVGLLLLLGIGGGSAAAYVFWYLPNLPQNIVAASMITTLEGYPLQSQGTDVKLDLYFDGMQDPVKIDMAAELNPDGTMALEVSMDNLNQLISQTALSSATGLNPNIDEMTMAIAMDAEGTTYFKFDGMQPLSGQADQISALLSQSLKAGFATGALSEEELAELDQALLAAEASFSRMLRDLVSRFDGNWMSTSLAESDTFKQSACEIRALLNADNYTEDEEAAKALRNNYLDNQFVEAQDVGQSTVNGELITEYTVQLKKTELISFLKNVDLDQGGLDIKGLDACSNDGIDQPGQAPDSSAGQAIDQQDIDYLIDKVEGIDEEDMKFNLWVNDQKRIVQVKLEAANDQPDSNITSDPFTTALSGQLPEPTKAVLTISLDYNSGKGIVSDAASGSAIDFEAELEDLITDFETDLQTSLGLDPNEQPFISPRPFTQGVFDA